MKIEQAANKKSYVNLKEISDSLNNNEPLHVNKHLNFKYFVCEEQDLNDTADRFFKYAECLIDNSVLPCSEHVNVVFTQNSKMLDDVRFFKNNKEFFGFVSAANDNSCLSTSLALNIETETGLKLFEKLSSGDHTFIKTDCGSKDSVILYFKNKRAFVEALKRAKSEVISLFLEA